VSAHLAAWAVMLETTAPVRFPNALPPETLAVMAHALELVVGRPIHPDELIVDQRWVRPQIATQLFDPAPWDKYPRLFDPTPLVVRAHPPRARLRHRARCALICQFAGCCIGPPDVVVCARVCPGAGQSRSRPGRVHPYEVVRVGIALTRV
jgi:hypothetical protein